MEIESKAFVIKVINLVDMNHTIKRWWDNIIQIIIKLDLSNPTFMKQHFDRFNTLFKFFVLNQLLWCTNHLSRSSTFFFLLSISGSLITLLISFSIVSSIPLFFDFFKEIFFSFFLMTSHYIWLTRSCLFSNRLRFILFFRLLSTIFKCVQKTTNCSHIKFVSACVPFVFWLKVIQVTNTKVVSNKKCLNFTILLSSRPPIILHTEWYTNQIFNSRERFVLISLL